MFIVNDLAWRLGVLTPFAAESVERYKLKKAALTRGPLVRLNFGKLYRIDAPKFDWLER